MSCDVGKAREGLENELWRRWSDWKAWKMSSTHWRMSCDVGKEREGLENELWRRWSDWKALPTSQLILQPIRCFTYATDHSPTLLSLLLPHRIFTYVTWRAAHAIMVFLWWASIFIVYPCLLVLLLPSPCTASFLSILVSLYCSWRPSVGCDYVKKFLLPIFISEN